MSKNTRNNVTPEVTPTPTPETTTPESVTPTKKEKKALTPEQKLAQAKKALKLALQACNNDEISEAEKAELGAKFKLDEVSVTKRTRAENTVYRAELKAMLQNNTAHDIKALKAVASRLKLNAHSGYFSMHHNFGGIIIDLVAVNDELRQQIIDLL